MSHPVSSLLEEERPGSMAHAFVFSVVALAFVGAMAQPSAARPATHVHEFLGCEPFCNLNKGRPMSECMETADVGLPWPDRHCIKWMPR